MAWSVFNILRAVKRLEVKITPVVDKAGPILDSAKTLVDDARPKINDMIARADEIVVSARDQMARLESLVTEASDSARLQIERIDLAVGDTVNRVQETTAAVQSTILRPVREVNGVLAGIKTAISVYSHGQRRSVDHATQDEEMFI